jgi:hypothetical protein
VRLQTIVCEEGYGLLALKLNVGVPWSATFLKLP